MGPLLRLLGWIVVLEFLAFLSGYPKGGQTSQWYLTLQQSSLTPPKITFPIVWVILYAMIAGAGWTLWEKCQGQFKCLKGIYVIQLILNLSWTPIFFYFQMTGVAFFLIVLMILLVASFVIRAFSHCRTAAYLMVPYLLWICFACYLNGYIWLHN